MTKICQQTHSRTATHEFATYKHKWVEKREYLSENRNQILTTWGGGHSRVKKVYRQKHKHRQKVLGTFTSMHINSVPIILPSPTKRRKVSQRLCAEIPRRIPAGIGVHGPRAPSRDYTNKTDPRTLAETLGKDHHCHSIKDLINIILTWPIQFKTTFTITLKFTKVTSYSRNVD